MSRIYFTDRSIGDDRVCFNIDDGLDQDLIRYCDKICKKECGCPFDPSCGDCHVTRLYYAMTFLAEYEDMRLTPEEIQKMYYKQRKKATIVNYNKLPPHGKVTSDGEETRRCACGNKCYVFYDEERQYRVECEKCGEIVSFKTSSMDKAIKIWNDIPVAIEK
jgi:PHP family Zn ribbon phosphoesterase